MELFGIGGFEFALIVIIALIVAGPARMAVWARKLGQWTGQLRTLWRTAASQLQRELDDAGVDFKVPKDLPTRRAILDEINRSSTVKHLSQPIKEVQKALDEGKAAAGEITGALSSVERKMLEATSANKPAPAPTSRMVNSNGPARANPAVPPTPQRAPSADKGGFGTWSGDVGDASAGGAFGTWSQAPKDE